MKGLFKAITNLFYALAYHVIYTPKVLDEDWKKLLTKEEYLSKHPECAGTGSSEPSCCFCGSKDVIFQPLTNNFDRRHKHFCTTCKRALFRSEAFY